MFVSDGFISTWAPLSTGGQSTVKNISEHPLDAECWLTDLRKCRKIQPVWHQGTLSRAQAPDHGLCPAWTCLLDTHNPGTRPH